MAHAILVTWRNMEPRVLPHFIAKAQAKYGADFHQVYFDSETVGAELTELVAAVPAADRLKIFISGHGGVGIEFITDDTQARRKSVQELIDLLVPALAARCADRADCARTQVNMVSCLFGRSADGVAISSPAAKLHQGLAERDVFVDLVARTESVVVLNDGRNTVSILNHEVYEPEFGRQLKFMQRKVPFTKVLHTYREGARVVSFASYDEHSTYLDTATLEGRRVLWADQAVRELVRHIQLKGTGLLGKGPKEVTDERQRVLRDIVATYDAVRNPALLKMKLERLVDGTGTDTRSNFLLHRNVFSQLTSSAKPTTALLVEGVLRSYPAA
jgi:hypothetical protein